MSISIIHDESVFSSIDVNSRPLATDSLRDMVPLMRALKVDTGTSNTFAAAFLTEKGLFNALVF